MTTTCASGTSAPAGLALGSVQDDDTQGRGEAGELARPVADEASWGRRRAPARPGVPRSCSMQHVRDRLQRLAEPHLVGEDAADCRLARGAGGTRRPRTGTGAALLADRAAARSRRSGCDAGPGASRSRPRIGPRDARRPRAGTPSSSSTSALARISGNERRRRCSPWYSSATTRSSARSRVDGHRHVVRLADAQRPRRAARRRERVEAPVGVEPLEQVEQHGQQIDARPVDVHAELQAEPVGPARRWARRARTRRARARRRGTGRRGRPRRASRGHARRPSPAT